MLACALYCIDCVMNEIGNAFYDLGHGDIMAF